MTLHSPDRAPWTEDELDDALGALLALADDGHPAVLPVTASTSRRHRIAPVLIAAAVAALLTAGVVLVVGQRADHERRVAAGTLMMDGRVADLGGVRFPVPDDWSVGVTQDDAAVTACIARTPTGGSCDGVTLIIASDGTTLPSSVDASVEQTCPGARRGLLRRDEALVPVGGRPAGHFFDSCEVDGPTAHLWMLFDRSLAVTTPTGKWADQGTSIAAGLDLTRWPRSPGQQLMFSTPVSSAPATS